MSTSKGTGASSRLRIAGLMMFTVAVIAILIGLVVAVSRREPASATGEFLVPPTTAPPSRSVIAYPPPVPSIPAEAPVVSPSVPAPASSSVSPDAGERAPVSGERRQRGEVRVYNNSTIRGLAARAARDLAAAGWTVIEVGNYASGTIPTTTVYYQESTDQQPSAQTLGAEFGMRVEPRFAGISNAGPGLIVIVTNDYSR
ncbi:MAG: LytR C-terminal domain-containing protein [Pseudonocardiaceae bacterium]